jgi:hypothetical protein
MKMIFAREVIQSVLMNKSPACNRTPLTAKMTARRKRGSERKSPFQLDSIAQSDKGDMLAKR